MEKNTLFFTDALYRQESEWCEGDVNMHEGVAREWKGTTESWAHTKAAVTTQYGEVPAHTIGW